MYSINSIPAAAASLFCAAWHRIATLQMMVSTLSYSGVSVANWSRGLACALVTSNVFYHHLQRNLAICCCC